MVVTVVAERLSSRGPNSKKKKKKSRQGASASGEEERSQSGVAGRAERELWKPQAGATDRLRPI